MSANDIIVICIIFLQQSNQQLTPQHKRGAEISSSIFEARAGLVRVHILNLLRNVPTNLDFFVAGKISDRMQKTACLYLLWLGMLSESHMCNFNVFQVDEFIMQTNMRHSNSTLNLKPQ